MPKGKFDAEAFYTALDDQRRSKDMTWKQVAKEAEVSASTLTRMAQGKRPDVDSMAALAAWSGLSTDAFIKHADVDKLKSDSLPAMTAYLRADSNLSEQSADAIEAILRAAYEQLREN
ncbi:helix-turn-helix domain-containing protein [cf. Phormidesmis sp. LEGE 11477]|uniref:helix-turn-helix domain-containing protein n=1 Tax=cf. Phormidesmis sp. LEGE 11477 TaxID=1828680 RepID=UPI00188121CD|nr:helix-turn-helix domain-containing protein [cf. Phormidesmis sp. LEGE 11477]MBE9064101.1 helix-turn-helix transcriptional regulator [cf. Phormidesmis sp. LEGE 11477]